jgi:hypothetical protein
LTKGSDRWKAAPVCPPETIFGMLFILISADRVEKKVPESIHGAFHKLAAILLSRVLLYKAGG